MINPINQSQAERLIRIDNISPNTKVYTEESFQTQQQGASQVTRMTKTKQWTSTENVIIGNVIRNDNEFDSIRSSRSQSNQRTLQEFDRNVPATQYYYKSTDNLSLRPFRNNYSVSKSPSPNPNTLHRKHELRNPPPPIKFNISLAPHLKIRESEFQSSRSNSNTCRASSVSTNNDYESSFKRNYLTTQQLRNLYERGTSPFTYIETTSIKRKPNKKRRYANDYNETIRSSRSTPSRKEIHKTLLFTKVSPSPSPSRCKSVKEFEENEFRAFERECEELRRSKLAKMNKINSQYNTIRLSSERYSESLNDVKKLIELMQNTNNRITKTEEKLCNLVSTVEVSSVENLSSDIERLLVELKDLKNSIKTRQDESLINEIIELTDQLRLSSNKIKYEVPNLLNLLIDSDKLLKRYRELTIQISDREAILNQILRCTEQYKKSNNIQTNWFESINYKINIQQKQQQQQQQQSLRSTINGDIDYLKDVFDSNAKIFNELGLQDPKIEQVNEIGIKLIQLLKRYNRLLNDYYQYINIESTTRATNNIKLNYIPSSDIINEIRTELNHLNKQYATLLREYNTKIKTLTNNIAKSDKQFSFHITFKNVEPLIDKYNKDIFERYELIEEDLSSSYYDKDLMDINTIDVDNTASRLYSTSHNTTTTTTNNYENGFNYSPSFSNMNPQMSTVRYFASKINQLDTGSKFHPNQYPLSFIDAVNRKQLDLESGFFKDPINQTYTMRLYDALQKGYLNPKSAYVFDPRTRKSYYLDEAFQNSLINAQNRINDSTSSQTLSLSDALKCGYLKLGEFSSRTSINGNNNNNNNNNNNCSVTSETQSMSVRSIKDPLTGEFLVPTEAIKRKLLDPYNGLFLHPNGERLPISEAIKKGFVIVEMLSDLSSSQTSSMTESRHNSSSVVDTNLISTNLVRETKSYHLMGVYDPTKNDEITIKEAINKGILDRQRGLYIHPITKECFSISDAINKGVIRARVLMPPSEIPYESLISTNKFQENKTYTICGAIDPRNNRPIGLSRAIREGIINTNNGTYINIVTGEVITLNIAIEKGLVLTDPKQLDNNVSNITHPLNREVKTLTIEFVKDPRSGRNLTVIEAMQNGILDRQTLHYFHPITGENFSLNKAYEKGFIIGHYTDSYTNEIRTQINSITTTTRKDEKYYIIVSVYDPRKKQSISLDEAIKFGLFDPIKGVYIHPNTKEVINIGDAVSKNLIEAKIHDDLIESEPYDTRLPIGDFGIDKKITSMRTKYNQEGRSILQIDIESTKPTKGVYEVDEIEEYTIKEPKPRHHTEYIIDRHDDSQHEYRQVIDINSVHRIPAKQTTEHTIHHTQIDVPVTNVHKEKNVVVLEINKQIGTDFRVERNEKVIDDDADSRNRQILQIDIHKRNEIPERRPYIPYTEEIQRVETLVIDDVDTKRQKPLNIDSETHSYNNKLIIDSQRAQVIKQKTTEVLQINEFMKTNEPSKLRTEIIDDTKAQSSTTYLTIDDTRKRTEKRKETIDISEIIKDEKPRKQEVIDDYQTIKKRNVYEDITDVTKKEKKPEEDEWRSESFEQRYFIQKTFNKVKEQPEEQRTDQWTEYLKEKTKKVQKPDDDDDEEFFEEWTEVYTITIRGIKYKITWVYDPVISQRIPLVDAIRKGIIDLKTNSYHDLKTSHSFTISEAYDHGLIGLDEDKNAFIIIVNGITYTIYWVWDPVKKKRISPKRAIERGLLDLENKVYRNYANGETISIHEAIYMKLIGASEDLSSIDEELTLTINDRTYKIAWVKDSRTGDKVKPREALRRGLLDLTRYTYKKHDTNELLTIIDAIRLNYIGVSSGDEDDEGPSLQRQDSLLSIDEDELTIKTKTAIYIITGLLHPETQKEIKVSEAIEAGILNKETGAYKDFKTNVVYEVGDAINEGIVFATVTDLLQDQSASTEFIREEIKRYIVKSVIDPRTSKRIGGLQAQAAGILNYAQGVYTNPDTRENMPIGEAIGKGLIKVELQEESSHEEFDAEVVTETLMERCITNYRIFDLGVLDPASHEMISGNEAVHKQVIDTETNSYVDINEVISLKDAVSQNKVLAEVTERIERKPLGLALQNALRLGLFVPDSGLFKDPYTNKQMKLNEAIERGHINPNGSAVSDSTKGMMTLNEAFAAGIFDKRDGVLNKTRLSMFKGKLADSKLIRWNFDDAVKCGIVNLKNGKYKHMQSGELLSLRDAITRGLIDGDSTIIENPTTNILMTLRTALDTVKLNDNGEVIDPINGKCITTLESAFNSRKIFSAFDENTGEIFLTSRGKIVSFEKAVRKNKMDKDVRIFDPKQNKELSVNDCIEHGILDRTSGMVIDPKSGGLLSIKEAVKRGIVSISGAPVVTGHHDSEAVEKATITSRKERHLLQPFDDVHDDDNGKSKSRRHMSNNSSSFDRSTLSSSKIGRTKSSNFDQDEQDSGRFSFHTNKLDNNSGLSSSSYINTSTLTRKKTPIVYDPDGTTTSIVKDSSYILSSDPNEKVVTKVTTKTEEHHTTISGDDVKDKVKKTMKETVLEPDRQPHITASTSYEYETKSKVDQTKTAEIKDNSTNGKVLDVLYEVESNRLRDY